LENDLAQILIAGGFGNYIRRSHAKRIGLIPNIPDEKIKFIGNTSILGAQMLLTCREKLAQADELAMNIDCFDVSLDPEFQMEFAEAMIFPTQSQF